MIQASLGPVIYDNMYPYSQQNLPKLYSLHVLTYDNNVKRLSQQIEIRFNLSHLIIATV